MSTGYRVLVASLLAGLLSAGTATAVHAGDLPGDAKPGNGTPAAWATRKGAEGLLKETGFLYKQIKEGVYKVMVEGNDGETSAVIVEERKASWKDSKGGDVTYVMVWTAVLEIPAEAKPPAALFRRIEEINDRYYFGSLGLSKPATGKDTVYRNYWLFLRAGDSETLKDLCSLAHNDRLSVRKELLPLLQDGKAAAR
jgi:hypothetical protein